MNITKNDKNYLLKAPKQLYIIWNNLNWLCYPQNLAQTETHAPHVTLGPLAPRHIVL